jgi:peptidylprolyl isomerase/FKBP-type peptidyl-prolyl cis-trans isomerase FklB
MRRSVAVTLGICMLISSNCIAAPVIAKLPVGKVRLPVLSYTVDKSGPATGEHPKRSDMITVNYSLHLLNGTEIDGSAKRGKPDVFPLNRLIPAWQILLQKMRPGDAWTFYVPPEYAYGSISKEGLPANSFLVFKVELLSFAPTPVDSK